MRWQNKGHEFDHVYKNLAEKSGFWLFGAGMYGEAMHKELEKMESRILGFIDNNELRRHREYMGKEILSLQDISLKDHEAIIVCVSPFSRSSVMRQLMLAGYIYNQNVFTMETYMSLKYVYDLKKMYIPSISFLPSTVCNLNCEACLNFTPYIKHQMIRSLEQVKEDVDIFFHAVDYIMLFHISGGEPFLYPHLKELVIYIGENYREKIHFFQTVTNGTVMPEEEILEILAKYEVGVTVDDYREAVPEKADIFEKVVKKLQRYHIRYDVNKVDHWIDLAPTKTDHSTWDERRLIKHFEACHEPWQELRGGRLYSCNYASYGAVAGLAEEVEDETFDLRNFDRSRIKELMEFRMGYNEKGYVDFCKKCAGFVDINENIVEPAKQKRRSI
ncbi:MAG: radical SAM protein [Hungatella sp.]|nr:radical SAM protein [Hungatella sp.]